MKMMKMRKMTMMRMKVMDNGDWSSFSGRAMVAQSVLIIIIELFNG